MPLCSSFLPLLSLISTLPHTGSRPMNNGIFWSSPSFFNSTRRREPASANSMVAVHGGPNEKKLCGDRRVSERASERERGGLVGFEVGGSEGWYAPFLCGWVVGDGRDREDNKHRAACREERSTKATRDE